MLVDPTVDYGDRRRYVHRQILGCQFGGSWSGDMAFTGSHIWQVNVGGDNAITRLTRQVLLLAPSAVRLDFHLPEVLPTTPTTTRSTSVAERRRIYKIKGESWDNPGQVINLDIVSIAAWPTTPRLTYSL